MKADLKKKIIKIVIISYIELRLIVCYKPQLMKDFLTSLLQQSYCVNSHIANCL